MQAMTPLPDDATFVITTDGETLMVNLFQDGGDGPDIAWQAPEADADQFRWLVTSAAAFHKIRVEDDSLEEELEIDG